MQFSLVGSQVQSLTPFTLGFAFRAGDVAAGQSVVSADVPRLQVVAKNRWPDGSLKFAVVSGLAALLANVPLTVRLSPGATVSGASALTLAELKATGITAAVTTSAFGEASWAAADWDAPFKQWVSGPEMSSWLFRKPLGSDAHLVAWLEVRLYAGGAVEVLPWLENGYLLIPGATNKLATYAFRLGGTERFSADINLPNHCRTPLVSGASTSHWLGNDPRVTPKHDTGYLQSTDLVPSYMATVPPDAPRVKALAATFTPLQQSNLPAGMGAAGYHPSIGLLPEWDVLYLTSTSQAAYTGVIFNAYSAGRYGIHWRDEKTQAPALFASYPGYNLGSGSGIGDSGASSTNQYFAASTGTVPATWKTSHHPAVGYLAYLVTGAFYHLETLQFAAVTNHFRVPQHVRQGATGLQLTDSVSTRGSAWALRTLALAATATPDADTVQKNQYVNTLANSMTWYHARYVAQANNPQGYTREVEVNGAPSNDAYTPRVDPYSQSSFMHNFLTGVLGWCKALRIPFEASVAAKFEAFYVWKARSVIGLFGGTDPSEYLYRDAGLVVIQVAPRDNSNWINGTGPWYDNFGQMWDATHNGSLAGYGQPARTKALEDGSLRGGFFPSGTSYWGNLQPAIAYAVQHRLPGALEGYRRMTEANNWSQLTNSFNKDPVWSVRPSNLP
ncbi:MAG: hypothetical protein RIS44_2917 [Pseudomonadota bacterium]